MWVASRSFRAFSVPSSRCPANFSFPVYVMLHKEFLAFKSCVLHTKYTHHKNEEQKHANKCEHALLDALEHRRQNRNTNVAHIACNIRVDIAQRRELEGARGFAAYLYRYQKTIAQTGVHVYFGASPQKFCHLTGKYAHLTGTNHIR